MAVSQGAVDGKPTHDVVIIGGGHNGLTCAAYLAKAGLDVHVVERRGVVGGTAVTEEFHPGFRNSVAAYTVSLLNPKIIEDLRLHDHGLQIVERRMNNFWPLDDEHYLSFPLGQDAVAAEIARFSAKDAETLPRYYADIGRIADIVRGLVLETPPNAGGGWREMIHAGLMARRFSGITLEDQRLLLDLFTKSTAEFLGAYFESDAVMAAFAFDGIVGFYGSPTTPGSAYVLLHHAFGEVNGKKGIWGHAIGGMGAISDALRKAAEAAGATIETDAPVDRVIVEGSRVRGVMVEGGREVRARAVAANVGPKLLYLDMIDEDALPDGFRHRMENFVCGSGTLRMNVALSELPSFTCLPGRDLADHHTAGIVIGPTMDYLDHAYMDARRDGWSRAPIVEMLISSTMDDSLAPKGQHVASLFCQQFAPELPNGKSWDDCRDEVADLVIATVDRYAPGFKDSVLGRQVLTPLDLERKFGLVGGDIFHGRLSLDQMFAARPQLGYGNYRGAVPGLYHCGAGAHPGGGVTGAPGHNAAREIIKDFKRGRIRD